MPQKTANTDADFSTMTLPELCAWYVENVGYNPVEDDPTITLEHVRENCEEHALIELCEGIDTEAYHRIEALRRVFSEFCSGKTDPRTDDAEPAGRAVSFEEVLGVYRALLELHPGKPFVIFPGNAAVLIDDELFGCSIVDGFAADVLFKLDREAFDEEKGGWEGNAVETMRCINQPRFLKLWRENSQNNPVLLAEVAPTK